MNKNDVFQKSELGRAEIKNQQSDLLIREARTLLIFIDGKKTYQQYRALLDKSKIFAEAGGIAPFFELLIVLGMVELSSTSNADTETTAQNDTSTALDLSAFKTTTAPQAGIPPVASTPHKEQPSAFAHTIAPNTSDGSDFDTLFGNQMDGSPADVAPNTLNSDHSSKRPRVDLHFESVKSKLATHIEQRAAAQDAWSHMLNLEQCDDEAALLAFIKDIQRTDNSALSRDIETFSKMLE